jgi:uracil-DNA glycosylase
LSGLRHHSRVRPLIVGQAPSKDSRFPLVGPSGDRLSRILGRPIGEAADVANLLGWWPGGEGKDDEFPLAAATVAASHLLASDLQHRRLVLLGLQVARAFGVGCLAYFEWHRLGWHVVAAYPHPSGVSRWWNDPSHRRAAREWLRDALSSGEWRSP